MLVKRRAVANYSLFTSEGAVAHARGGAQSRDDGGDDAADDLEDGLPRFLFHGVKWFLSGLIKLQFSLSCRIGVGGGRSVSHPVSSKAPARGQAPAQARYSPPAPPR